MLQGDKCDWTHSYSILTANLIMYPWQASFSSPSVPFLSLLMLYLICINCLCINLCFKFSFLGKPRLWPRVWGPIKMFWIINKNFVVFDCQRRLQLLPTLRNWALKMVLLLGVDCANRTRQVSSEAKEGTSLVAQWLRLCTLSAGDLGLILAWATRSCLPQLRSATVN